MRNVSSETFCSLAAGGGAGWQRRDTFYYARQGRRVGAAPGTGDSADAAYAAIVIQPTTIWRPPFWLFYAFYGENLGEN